MLGRKHAVFSSSAVRGLKTGAAWADEPRTDGVGPGSGAHCAQDCAKSTVVAVFAAVSRHEKWRSA
jgi:hypothetical protein